MIYSLVHRVLGNKLHAMETRKQVLGPYNPRPTQNPIVVQAMMRAAGDDSRDCYVPEKHLLFRWKKAVLRPQDIVKRRRIDAEAAAVIANMRSFVMDGGKLKHGSENLEDCIEFMGVAYDTLPDHEMAHTRPHSHGRLAVIVDGATTIAANKEDVQGLELGNYISWAPKHTSVMFDAHPNWYYTLALEKTTTANRDRCIGKILGFSSDNANELYVQLDPMRVIKPP